MMKQNIDRSTSRVVPIRARPAASEETITAADIEAWARVERALSGKRDDCRRLLAQAIRATPH
ncbi:hypothetical protein [Sphingobium sp.]|uniref:hypothetical protein n=1 Tax=Sphingobium sp. TaxID=1912891 RepID=UPI0026181E75|nr:hypothetical protein [Sphingobium sp.]